MLISVIGARARHRRNDSRSQFLNQLATDHRGLQWQIIVLLLLLFFDASTCGVHALPGNFQQFRFLVLRSH